MVLKKKGKSALVVLPTEAVSQHIRTLRDPHDKDSKQWMPNLTLIHPFVAPSQFAEVLPVIRLALAAAQVRGFDVHFSRLNIVHRGTSVCLFAYPDNPRALVKIRNVIGSLFPRCFFLLKRLTFTPHILIGTYRSRMAAEKAMEEMAWYPLSFSVDRIHLIAKPIRNTPPGTKRGVKPLRPYRVLHNIQLPSKIPEESAAAGAASTPLSRDAAAKADWESRFQNSFSALLAAPDADSVAAEASMHIQQEIRRERNRRWRVRRMVKQIRMERAKAEALAAIRRRRRAANKQKLQAKMQRKWDAIRAARRQVPVREKITEKQQQRRDGTRKPRRKTNAEQRRRQDEAYVANLRTIKDRIHEAEELNQQELHWMREQLDSAKPKPQCVAMRECYLEGFITRPQYDAFKDAHHKEAKQQRYEKSKEQRQADAEGEIHARAASIRKLKEAQKKKKDAVLRADAFHPEAVTKAVKDELNLEKDAEILRLDELLVAGFIGEEEYRARSIQATLDSQLPRQKKQLEQQFDLYIAKQLGPLGEELVVGSDPKHHIEGVRKMVPIGEQLTQCEVKEMIEYDLSQFSMRPLTQELLRMLTSSSKGEPFKLPPAALMTRANVHAASSLLKEKPELVQKYRVLIQSEKRMRSLRDHIHKRHLVQHYSSTACF
jgi:hypothetical protein